MGFILAWCMPRYIWGPTVKPKVPLGYPYIFVSASKAIHPQKAATKFLIQTLLGSKRSFHSPIKTQAIHVDTSPPPQVERKFVYVGHSCICSLSSSWRLLSFKGIYLVYRAQMMWNKKAITSRFFLEQKTRKSFVLLHRCQYTKFWSLQECDEPLWSKNLWAYNVYPAGVAFKAVL